MEFLLPLLLSCFLVLLQSAAEEIYQSENTTLLLVQAIIRQGDSAPLLLYKNDSNEADIWPGGLGKLTQIGKRQHYAIGKFLRSMYKDFLTTDPNEVCANSSIVDRCLIGAIVTATTLYEPEGIWKFEDDVDWQPIPVFYLPKDEDKYLYPGSPCPRAFKELDRLLSSEEMYQLAKNHQKMLDDVSEYVGEDISEQFRALFLYDTLLVEKIHNFTIPTLLDNYFEELEEFADATFQTRYGSDLIKRLRFGPLLGEISENMMRKINGNIPDLKFQLYIVEDVYVAALLDIFSVLGMPRPPYCATLLLELHKMADATMSVRLLYMNSTDPLTDMEEPHVLVLDDCSEFCPLENFTKKFRRLIPEDWEEECELDDGESDPNKPVKVLVVFLAVATVVCFVSLCCVFLYLYCNHCKSKRKIQDEKEKCTATVTAWQKNVT